jgi:signal transduction histidine kinase
MTVRDHGRGFHQEAGASFPGHLGFRSMRERAEALGGTFMVESAAHAGTAVRVRLPLRSTGV